MEERESFTAICVALSKGIMDSSVLDKTTLFASQPTVEDVRSLGQGLYLCCLSKMILDHAIVDSRAHMIGCWNVDTMRQESIRELEEVGYHFISESSVTEICWEDW